MLSYFWSSIIRKAKPHRTKKCKYKENNYYSNNTILHNYSKVRSYSRGIGAADLALSNKPITSPSVFTESLYDDLRIKF